MTRSNIIKYRMPAHRSRARHRVKRAFSFLAKICMVCTALFLFAFPDVSKKLFHAQTARSLQSDTDSRPKVINGGDAWGGSSGNDNRFSSKSQSVPGNHVSGRVTYVRDGDTIEVSGVPIRIANLDCAETGTAAGAKATRHIKQLVTAERLDCRLSGRMSYDRHVGTCRLSNGRDIGEVLIAQGYCRRWR